MNGCIFCAERDDKIRNLEAEIDRLKKVEVHGWKGKDRLEIEKKGTNWILVENRKDKHTGNIAKTQHTIPEINVANLWEMIKTRINIGGRTNSKTLALDLITKRRLPVGLDEFWGGKCRAKLYFPLLYFPLKILERKKFITYGGRGSIKRLKQ